jgi:hypothetical protein
MRTAETILNIIQDRGKRKLPLDDVYRQLYNPAMYLRSYAKLYKNQGAMTPGHWFSLMGTVLPFEIITYAI